MDEKLDKLIRLLIDNGISLNRVGDWFCCTELELDFSEHDKVFEDKIAELEKQIERVMREKQLAYDRSEQLMKTADILNSANKELKQRIAELESKETETCEKEPKVSDSAPSIEWYENRHQSDCIEINRLNTTIDVLIHKVEYLRQFAGLE